MKTTFFPKEFLEKYQEILGTDFDSFFEISQTKLKKSIWVNSLKIQPKELKKILEHQNWRLKQLTFHLNSFTIISGPQKPGQIEEFAQGLFNLQEVSSMLPALVLSPEKNSRVLDCTAAPGNKTLQLACSMNNTGKLAVVEKNNVRAKSLNFNLKKWNVHNAKVFEIDFLNANFKEKFDFVLLDAPCSSEGLVRKRKEALKEWSQELVKRKSKLQKKLIVQAFNQLKENGTLVYSVCSLSPEECEEVIHHLLDKQENVKIEKIKIKGIKIRKGLTFYNGKTFEQEIENCARIYPQDNDSQAFFMTKIKKTVD
ncbi:MAG: RsmB/NOP family class I SAM-dependent RNA methyltransferase [Candidatus Diapherotrites archaeon]|nr:RsmB/NOP family class I SAM-dependent RNA methyltransferase [Candidatus Diapherotrites archaeon]